jgi:hypothetical protein
LASILSVTAAVWPISSVPYLSIGLVIARTSTPRSLWARAPSPDSRAVAQFSVMDVSVAWTALTPFRIDPDTRMDTNNPRATAIKKAITVISRACSKVDWIRPLRVTALALADAASLSRLAISLLLVATSFWSSAVAAAVLPALASP